MTADANRTHRGELMKPEPVTTATTGKWPAVPCPYCTVAITGPFVEHYLKVCPEIPPEERAAYERIAAEMGRERAGKSRQDGSGSIPESGLVR
jgi:hypothetical protein